MTTSFRRSLVSPLRRTGLAFAAAAALGAGPAVAQTAAWPDRPVTLVTPSAAGSGPDAVLSLVADKLGKAWKQRVLIDNRPGGAGFIAIDAARRAPADGYTLLQLDSEHLAALPHLYRSRGFETLKVFDPVAGLFRTPFMVAVATDSRWRSMVDLLAAAKAAPGRVSYGSWGVGSPGHLGGGQIEAVTGVTMQHVPYREMSPLYTSVASGDVAWSFASLPSSRGVHEAGRIRYLAVAAPKRVPQMPDVPTVAEAGGPPGLDVNSFVVLVAPKGGLPAAVGAKVAAEVRNAVEEPDVKTRFESFAFEPIHWSAEEIARNAEAQSRTYGELVRRGSISLE